MHLDYVGRGVRPRLSRRGRSIASRAECLALQFYYNDVFGRVFTFNVFPLRVVHHHFDSRKTLSLLSFVKPGWSTTGRVPVRALRATHPIHRPIWVCLIRRLLRRSRVRFLPNRTREQTPTKSVGRKAQRESDISSIFTSRGR